jgi:RNA polymerase-binding transcription factor DksA
MSRHKELARRITAERRTLQMQLRGMVHQAMIGFWGGKESSGNGLEDHVGQAQQEFLKEQEARVYELLTSRIKVLNQAWQNLQRGTYGVCQFCGSLIPRRRLEAVPGAVSCISCQEQMERVA